MFEDLEDAYTVEEFLSGSVSKVAGSSSPPGPVQTAKAPTATGPVQTAEVPTVVGAAPIAAVPVQVPRAHHVVGALDDAAEEEDVEEVLETPVPVSSVLASLPPRMTTRKRSALAAPVGPPSKRRDSRPSPLPKPSSKSPSSKEKGKAVAADASETEELPPHLEGALTTLNEHVSAALWDELERTPPVKALDDAVASSTVVSDLSDF